jgi:hypothetical protein
MPFGVQKPNAFPIVSFTSPLNFLLTPRELLLPEPAFLYTAIRRFRNRVP